MLRSAISKCLMGENLHVHVWWVNIHVWWVKIHVWWVKMHVWWVNIHVWWVNIHVWWVNIHVWWVTFYTHVPSCDSCLVGQDACLIGQNSCLLCDFAFIMGSPYCGISKYQFIWELSFLYHKPVIQQISKIFEKFSMWIVSQSPCEFKKHAHINLYYTLKLVTVANRCLPGITENKYMHHEQSMIQQLQCLVYLI